MATPDYGTPVGAQRSNRWQDWSNLVLAIWLFISPWVLQFTAGPPGGVAAGGAANAAVAAWDAWVLGVIIFLVSLSAIGRMEFWQEWINLLLGIWVFIAPWVLGFVGLSQAAWDHWVVGALVFLIAICNIAVARRRFPETTAAYAGDKPTPKL
jgi:hypothetical protein